MNKIDQAYIIAQRAEALAIVYLTRRPDLLITPSEENTGPDLLVHLREDSQRTTRTFGLQVKGLLTINGTQSNAEGEWTLPHLYTPLPMPIAIPVCAFLFVMDTDQGFYRWLQEPVVTAEGAAELHLNQKEILRLLDNDSLGSVVAQVNHWYEVKESHPQSAMIAHVG